MADLAVPQRQRRSRAVAAAAATGRSGSGGTGGGGGLGGGGGAAGGAREEGLRPRLGMASFDELDLYGDIGAAGGGAGGAGARAGADGGTGDDLEQLSVFQLRELAQNLRGERDAARAEAAAAVERAGTAERRVKTLITNISSLYRTAGAELKRTEERANDAIERARRGEDVKLSYVYASIDKHAPQSYTAMKPQQPENDNSQHWRHQGQQRQGYERTRERGPRDSHEPRDSRYSRERGEIPEQRERNGGHGYGHHARYENRDDRNNGWPRRR